MRSSIGLTAVTAAAALWATAASATIVQADVTGTVSSGIDLTGDFGPAGIDLTGQGFDIAFTFDTALNPPFANQFSGGPNTGTAVVTINGVAYNVPNDSFSEWFAYAEPTDETRITENITVTGTGAQVYVRFIGIPGLIPPGGQPLLAQPSDSDPCLGAWSCTGYLTTGHGALVHSVYFTPDHLTITADGPVPAMFIPVPEPSAWAMLIVGAGAIGAKLRQRQLRRAAA